MSNLKNQDPDIFGIINSEVQRQNDFLELIASENFTSKAVLEAVLSTEKEVDYLFINKEGIPQVEEIKQKIRN